jgi:toxin-antitoxin system PIN domain toxin
MSFTVDANVLIYASNTDAAEHGRALDIVNGMISGPSLSVVFWPVLMAYLRISTHPRILSSPLTTDQAQLAVEQLIAAPSIRVVGEGSSFWPSLRSIRVGAPIRGNDIMDAAIVALMMSYGVSTIYTRDRGFRRFDGIRVLDPFS